MSNLYLLTVLGELSKGVEEMKYLKTTLVEFMSDSTHIDGMDGVYPSPLIEKAQKAVEEAIFQTSLVNDLIKEVIEDGRSN